MYYTTVYIHLNCILYIALELSEISHFKFQNYAHVIVCRVPPLIDGEGRDTGETDWLGSWPALVMTRTPYGLFIRALVLSFAETF